MTELDDHVQHLKALCESIKSDCDLIGAEITAHESELHRLDANYLENVASLKATVRRMEAKFKQVEERLDALEEGWS